MAEQKTRSTPSPQGKAKQKPRPFDEPKKVGSEACLAMMKSLGPVSKELESLLRLPKELYKNGSGFGRISFSSDIGSTGDELAKYLVFFNKEQEFPEVPDYLILMTSVGSNSLCILADRSRRIIVAETVKGIHSDQGSWDHFTSCLKDALAEAERFDGADFVIRGIRNLTA